ncbi:MAG: YfhO family protein [Lachnospiraceae bacterium]|nr:YfhO family protein [Lachnospiraceae bacterium]
MFIRKHLKLSILIIIELIAMIFIAMSLFGEVQNIFFKPSDFENGINDRNYISVNDEKLRIDIASATGGAGSLDDVILSDRFAIGSGAYNITVDYISDNVDGYINLYSENDVTETVSEQIPVKCGNSIAKGKLYIPFGRSMHDIQLEIGYSGNGILEIYHIEMKEDLAYRMLSAAGFILFFIVLDIILWIFFAVSAFNIRSFIRKHSEIPLLVSIILIASLPVFSDILYVGHDMEFHLARIIALSNELSYGQFPVRMLTDMLYGYGYPTSTYYCDLFIYPAAALYLLGMPLRTIWQIYVIFINTMTALISYVAFKNISSSTRIGVVGAALYTLSLYRIVDIYLRSALGEFTAITFIPLVIWGIWKIYYETDNDKYGWEILSAGLTGVFLSHLLSTEMVGLFLILFSILEYKLTLNKKRIMELLKAGIMTVLMSVWFMLPMLISLRNNDMRLFSKQKYIQYHGAYLSQIINPFGPGAGYSAPGTYKEMPLGIGGGLVVALVMLIYLAFKEGYKEKHRQRIAIIMVSVSMIFSLWLFPWDSIASVFENRIGLLSNLARAVQYPWRFLEITSVLLCLVAVCGLKEMLAKESGGKNDIRYWIFSMLLGTVISVGIFYSAFIDTSEWTRGLTESYTDEKIGEGEYLFSDAKEPTGSPSLTDINEASGTIRVTEYSSVRGERRIRLNNSGTETEMGIPLFAYPGYQAEDNETGKKFEITRGDNACLRIKVPGGYEGMIRVYYSEPLSWRLFEIISLVSFVGFVIHILIKKKTGKE